MDQAHIDQLVGFFKQYKSLNYKKGEMIIHAYDQPGGIYYLDTGYVKMNSILANGEELNLNIFKPGSYFPMVWAIAEVENVYSYQTMTEVVIYKAPKAELLAFLKDTPEILYDLTRRILLGMDGLLTNIQYMLFGNAYSRIASALLLCAKRFGEKKQNGTLSIELRLTHQDLANIAGLTRETTTLAVAKLTEKKIIKQEQGLFIIYDIEKLSQETSVDKELTSTPNTI